MEEAKPRSPRASGAAPTQPRGIEQIIKAAIDRGASDLHIKAGDVFRARIDGKLVPLTKRSEEHTSELQSQSNLVCRLLLEKKKEVKVEELLEGLGQVEEELRAVADY